MSRTLPDKDYMALKADVRQLTKLSGGQASAAMVTRADQQRICRYGRPDDAMHAPIDVVADMERDVGTPVVTRRLADLAGCILVPKPHVGYVGDWSSELGVLGKEAGEALSKLGHAIAGTVEGGVAGTVTADESRELELRREVREAMEVLARIDHALDLIEKSDGTITE